MAAALAASIWALPPAQGSPRVSPRRNQLKVAAAGVGRASFSYLRTRPGPAGKGQRVQPGKGQPGTASRLKPPPLIPVPPVRQAHNWTCGPASLQSVLAYYGKADLRENQLAKRAKANYHVGTQEKDLARLARQSGLTVKYKHRMSLRELKSYVSKGVPVIVGYQAWTAKPDQVDWRKVEGDGHYSVVIGMDKKNVWLMDPSMDLGKRGYIPVKEFMQRWHWSNGKGDPAKRFGMALMSDVPPARRSFVDSADRIR